jgi:hypothetical protein
MQASIGIGEILGVKELQVLGQPVIGVNTDMKELVEHPSRVDTTEQWIYSSVHRLLFIPGSIGSNGYSTMPWKTELQRLGNGTGLKILICDLPLGTSKRNKIEHRLLRQRNQDL